MYEKIFNHSQEKEKCKTNPTQMGKNNPTCPLASGGWQLWIFLCLLPPQQSLKGPYEKFQKKILSYFQEIVEHREKQTKRQTDKQADWFDRLAQLKLEYSNMRITWELEFSQTYNFLRTLKDRKYFHFRPFQTKVTWSPKTLFLCHFNLFWRISSVWEPFPKIGLCHLRATMDL